VIANRKRWVARIFFNSKEHRLGTFDTKQEAALAYDKKARKCREYKALNYDSLKAAEEAALQAKSEHILVHPPQPKPRPPSGFYGVSARGKRCVANIRYKNQIHYLGRFDTKQEAALAYDRVARQCGEDKSLNYENIEAAEEAAAQAQAGHALVHDLRGGPAPPKKRPSSGFYGVSTHGKRWKSILCCGGKQQHLGCFGTKEEAALAYDTAARPCGEQKALNYESVQAAEEAVRVAVAGQVLTEAAAMRAKPVKIDPVQAFAAMYAMPVMPAQAVLQPAGRPGVQQGVQQGHTAVYM
jgi:hypothetical protein